MHADDSTRGYIFGILDDGSEIFNDVFKVGEGFVQFIRDFACVATDVNDDTVRRKGLPVQAFDAGKLSAFIAAEASRPSEIGGYRTLPFNSSASTRRRDRTRRRRSLAAGSSSGRLGSTMGIGVKRLDGGGSRW